MRTLLTVDVWDNATGECEAEPIVVSVADMNMVSVELWTGETLIINRTELALALAPSRQEAA